MYLNGFNNCRITPCYKKKSNHYRCRPMSFCNYCYLFLQRETTFIVVSPSCVLSRSNIEWDYYYDITLASPFVGAYALPFIRRCRFINAIYESPNLTGGCLWNQKYCLAKAFVMKWYTLSQARLREPIKHGMRLKYQICIRILLQIASRSDGSSTSNPWQNRWIVYWIWCRVTDKWSISVERSSTTPSPESLQR